MKKDWKIAIALCIVSLMVLGIIIGYLVYKHSEDDINFHYYQLPTVEINANNEVLLIWYNIETEERQYCTIDNKGKTNGKLEEFDIIPDNIEHYRFEFDSENNIHVLEIVEIGEVKYENLHDDLESKDNCQSELYYSKIDNNGKLTINKKIIPTDNRPVYYCDLKIDENELIHLYWVSIRCPNWKIHHLGLDKDGNEIFHYQTEFNCSVRSFPVLQMDSSNNIILNWGNSIEKRTFFMKISDDGRILQNTTELSKMEVIPEVYIDNDEEMHFFKDYGVVDSRNQVHKVDKILTNSEDHQFEFIYQQVNAQGEIVVNKSICDCKVYVKGPLSILDSSENVNIIWKENDHFYYMEMDNSGNIIVEKQKII